MKVFFSESHLFGFQIRQDSHLPYVSNKLHSGFKPVRFKNQIKQNCNSGELKFRYLFNEINIVNTSNLFQPLNSSVSMKCLLYVQVSEQMFRHLKEGADKLIVQAES